MHIDNTSALIILGAAACVVLITWYIKKERYTAPATNQSICDFMMLNFSDKPEADQDKLYASCMAYQTKCGAAGTLNTIFPTCPEFSILKYGLPDDPQAALKIAQAFDKTACVGPKSRIAESICPGIYGFSWVNNKCVHNS